MNLDGLVARFRADLSRSAAVGGADMAAAAERLLEAVDPALRLTLLDALSQAAAEIAHALPAVSISVRVEGREPAFVVEAQRGVAPADDAGGKDDSEAIRITLRLPEALKARAETLAARRGQSLNTWLVAAARAAAEHDSPPSHRPGRRLKGWAR
jgi:hypothetical protein